MNKVFLMGRTCTNLELRATQNGTTLCNFSIAVRKAGTKTNEADFFDCVAWKKTAECITSYFQKGSMIAIEGKLINDLFTDKNGNKRKTTKVVVDNFYFCGDKKNNGDMNIQRGTDEDMSVSTTANNDFEEIAEDDDDLPF